MGLITELYISHKLLGFPLKDLQNIKKTFSEYFDVISFSDKDIEQIHDLMIYDKKNEADKLNFVLLEEIGSPVIDQQITKEFFIEAFKFYSKSL